MTALVSGLSRWIRARRGRDEPGDEGRVLRLEVVGPDEPGRRRRVYVGLQAERLLTLREPRHEPSRQGLEHDEDDEELERLVDRVGEQALLEDGRLEIGAGLLERGDEEVRAGTGHATEDDGRDRRRDDRRHDPADEARDRHVGDADVAADDEQDDEPDDRRR